jgi:predicted transcriptional regulator
VYRDIEPKRDELTIRAFVENYSLMLSERGVPRMAGRVVMTIMTAEEESLTAADLADRLGVSAAAVSGALKFLLHTGLIFRDSIPNSRRDRYRLTNDNWLTASAIKMDFLGGLIEEVDKVMDALGGTGTIAGARMFEVREFYKFVVAEMDRLGERWDAYRAEHGIGNEYLGDRAADL